MVNSERQAVGYISIAIGSSSSLMGSKQAFPFPAKQLTASPETRGNRNNPHIIRNHLLSAENEVN